MNSPPYSALVLLLSASTVAYMHAAASEANIPDAKSLSSTQRARVVEGYGKLPLSFEPNQGQADPGVKFVSRGDGYELSLTASELVMSLHGKDCSRPPKAQEIEHQTSDAEPCTPVSGSQIRMGLLNSNLDPKLEGVSELPGKSSYFIGHDPSSWHTNISNYSKVRYRDVYPGIDLIYYGNHRQLEHDFVVKPGGDPKAIRLDLRGAKEVSIDQAGNLALRVDQGALLLKHPSVYQEIGGIRRPISGSFIQKNATGVGFAVGAYDTKQELVIDPILVYSTYFPATVGYSIAALAVDPAGNTYAAEYPFRGTDQTIVQKLNADGSAVLYTTTVNSAQTAAIAVDARGNAYLTGAASANLPVVNAFQPNLTGSYNGFLTKLDPSGSNLLFSTYLGGTGTYANAIAVDALEGVYITGVATHNDLPVTTRLSVGTAGPFVTKFAPSGQSLDYSTYISGSNPSSNGLGYATGIAIDPAGEAIITGSTISTNFPLANALYHVCDHKHHLYSSCIFVTKINASGTGLLYSTFFGTGGGGAVATNASGDAFFSGVADSYGFPIVKALYPSTALSQANFLSRINATGSAVVYSTYLGDSIQVGGSIAVDGEDTYVTGSTKDGLPVVNPIQDTFGGQLDAYLMKVNGTGSALIFSTYLGGSSDDQASSVALDEYGNIYVSGYTGSQDFPLNNPLIYHYDPKSLYQTSFIAKIAPTSTFSITDSVDKTTVSPGGDLHYTVTVTNTSPSTASGVVEVTSVRDVFHTCTVSNGDPCRFVLFGGRASVSIDSLAPGSSRTILIYATAAKTAGDYNSITNKAVIAGISATAITTARETADVRVISSLVDSTNGVLHYLHTVTNLGPDNSHAILFLDQVPPHTTFVSAVTTAGRCHLDSKVGANGAVRCTLNNPDAGASVQVDVVLQAVAAACPYVTNTSYVTYQSIDPDPENDFSSVFTQLPASLCGPPPPPPPAYNVTFLEPPQYQGTIFTTFKLNNKGDLLASTGDLYKNGSTNPINIPVDPGSFNDLDDVLGNDIANGVDEQGIYKNGKFHAIDFGSASNTTFTRSINNLDEVSGTRFVNNGWVPFLYEEGKVHDLGIFHDGDYANPTGLNNKGEVTVGTYTEDASFVPALLYTHGLLLKLPSNDAEAIDDSGRVTGVIGNSDPTPLYIYSGGTTQVLSNGDNQSLFPFSINNCGEIVGQNSSGGGGFLYRNGRFFDLNAILALPYGLEFRPTSINNRGQIVGATSLPGSFNPTGFNALVTPAVLEKCGSDATIDNTPDLATSPLGASITYTITAKNLDTATSAFTVTDALDPTTSLISCSVSGGGGTCSGSPGGQAVTVTLPNLSKASKATITIKAAGSQSTPAQNVIMNTATLRSSMTADYLSTAYTSVP